MKDLTIGPQTYTQENLIDHSSGTRTTACARSTWGSDFGDMPFHVRDPYSNARVSPPSGAAYDPWGKARRKYETCGARVRERRQMSTRGSVRTLRVSSFS